uniref:Uncharacterized protein, isoform D n=1 Tax=Drosophila melanogaster TaxID=7227 RepID=X2J9G3_DROME|nr:uncharacterized protein Dmel_CG11034, isoform D [Drosophila melanogaster]AHN54152.1 uncharacterized protein Dmel_CG11034, isoform D [Drosophila melanogaster]|eukprot:NP_001285637.1 uncharacterized protein Dmel_CG11034, isoform D [Drosophila melanogaster]
MPINPLLITAFGLFITVCPRPSTAAAVIGRVDGAEGNKTAWELTEALYGTSGLRSFNGTWITDEEPTTLQPTDPSTNSMRPPRQM